MHRTRLRSSAARGFTLIELMVVIAILAVLTILAVTSYKYYVRRAHGQEARQLLMEIKMKQEQHFANYSEYVTANPGGTGYSNLYPTKNHAGDNTLWDWGTVDCTTPNPATDGWCLLGFRPQGPTRFRVGTWGWSPGTPAIPGVPAETAFDLIRNMDPSQRWYFAIAQRDADGDGTYATFIMTSQINDVVSSNETE